MESTTKLKYRLDVMSATTVKDVLKDHGWQEVSDENEFWNLNYCEVGSFKDALNSCHHNKNQRVPHFLNNYEITTKHMLYRNMKRFKKTLLSMGNNEEAELCECVPVTFELPSDYLMFVEEYRKQPGATWIVKPARGRKGKGIFLFQKLKDLIEWKDKEVNANKEVPSPSKATTYSDPPQESIPETWVIQKYIEKPYLFAGRKFDLRIYVLVTSFVPLKVWMAREGFARVSGSQYTMKSLVDNLIHLTNAALQLSGDITNQGCKWSLHKLREFLTASHGHTKIDELFQRIARIVMISLRSVEHVIINSKHCFELYGYDILLDKDLNPWLLEINASPTLTGTDQEDYKLKYNLIDDVFNILDYEGRLTGKELRVGGFDLIWNDRPIPKPVPVPGLKNNERITQPSEIILNSFLGCLNDREEHLNRIKLWKDYVLSKK